MKQILSAVALATFAFAAQAASHMGGAPAKTDSAKPSASAASAAAKKKTEKSADKAAMKKEEAKK